MALISAAVAVRSGDLGVRDGAVGRQANLQASATRRCSYRYDCDIQIGITGTEVAGSVIRKCYVHLFISFTHENLDFAENICSRVEKLELKAWYDQNIRVGQEWRKEIDDAIRSSFALVVIMTPRARTSEYVTYEWSFAAGLGIKVIPVLLESTDLHPRLEALQYLDFTSRQSRPWLELMAEIENAAQAPITYSVRIPSNSPPFVRQAIVALDSDNPQERERAVKDLAEVRTIAATTALLDAMRHPLSDVRYKVAENLGIMREPAAVPVLISAIGDSDHRVSQAVAGALGKLGDRAAVPALISALNSKDAQVLEAVAEALGKLGEPTAVRALINVLRHDDQQVRQVVARILGILGDKEAVPALLESLQDNDYQVRAAAARALGTLGDRTAVSALTKSLKDGEPVRLAATRALGAIGDPAALSALTDALKDDQRNAFWPAAEALGKLGDPTAVPVLIDILNDHNPQARRVIARALGTLGGPDAIAALIKSLKDNDSEVRLAAAVVLGDIGDSSCLPALEAMEDNPKENPEIRDVAAAAKRTIEQRTGEKGG